MTYTPEKVAELIAGAQLAADYPDVPTFASRMVSELAGALAEVTAERDAAQGVIRDIRKVIYLSRGGSGLLDIYRRAVLEVQAILSRPTTKGTPDANA